MEHGPQTGKIRRYRSYQAADHLENMPTLQHGEKLRRCHFVFDEKAQNPFCSLFCLAFNTEARGIKG